MLNTFPEGYKWPFLWEMIKRYYYYFRAINKGSLRPITSPLSDFKLQDIDIVFSFFILCFHLKDWIKKDYNSDIAETVEKFVESSRLNECREIANGLKHLNSVGPDIIGGPIKYIQREDSPPRMAVLYKIVSVGKEEDAFTLAKDCIDLWFNFMAENLNYKDLLLPDDYGEY
jgi:hypothetical protein